ncbi:alpha and gamma adaptin binding protein p34-domain-containing protein [Phyllosticta citribraziliensis]
MQSKPPTMQIANPRRIICVSAPDSDVLSFLKASSFMIQVRKRKLTDTPDLTGTEPPAPHSDSSVAGLSHALSISTSYYDATVPIWIDEIRSLPEWRTDYLSPAAGEVLSALGAWIYVFRAPLTQDDVQAVRDTLRAIREAVDGQDGLGMWDGVSLAVRLGRGETGRVGEADEWDEWCSAEGFEFVDVGSQDRPGTRNAFGEKVGVERVREALEANDWDGDDVGAGLDLGLGDEDGDEGDWHSSFAAEEAEMGFELAGMKAAIGGGADDDGDDDDDADQAAEVEELERMMSKLQGIKDTAAGMPEEQRKRFAAKAVNDLMKSP